MYLNDGVEHQVQVDANAVEGVRTRFAQGGTRIRELLADPASNSPKGESAVPQTANLSECTRCASRLPCGREAAAAKVA